MFLRTRSPEPPNRKFDLAFDLVQHGAGDADAGRLGDLLEPGGDVDAVTEEVVALDDDVAEVDADAEFHPLALRQIGVAAMERPLDRHGARTACTALPNSAMTLSPALPNTRPWCSATSPSITPR